MSDKQTVPDEGDTLKQMVLIAQLAAPMKELLPDFIQQCKVADEMVWILDPTLARAGGETNIKQMEAARALLGFLDAWDDFANTQNEARKNYPREARQCERELAERE